MTRKIISVACVALIVGFVVAGLSGVARAELVANWAFEELSGGIADDSMDNYNGDIDTGTNGPVLNQTGKIGKCFKFQGTANNNGLGGVSIAGTSDLLNNYSAYTTSAWFYYTANTKWQFPLQKALDGTYPQIQCLMMPPGQLQTQIRAVGDDRASYTNSGDYRNAWHLLTSTFDGSTGTVALYLDGDLLGSNTNGDVTTTGSNTHKTLIGSDNRTSGNFTYAGLLDDVSIWKDEVLSATKIKTTFTAPTAFSTDAGLGFYGIKDMDSLFKVYDDPMHALTKVINGKTWQYLSSMPGGHAAGQSWINGGNYYIQLGDGDGITAAVPEPGTLALLAAGLVGLLAYAWRKRK